MRWFFALNEASPSFWDYANLVQVAVHSAKTNTSLEPVCLYDGTDNPLTAWLEDADVPVIRCRTFLQEWVADLPPIPRGAYLRLEIPAVCVQHDWQDQWVLYTDCDVVFPRDPVPLLADLQPQFFAAAPESDRADYTHFNSGVMLINVAGLRAEESALKSTIKSHLQEAITAPYDQAALQRHFRERVDKLPLEANWKPYWGASDQACIVHFHGPKPAQKYLALNKQLPPAVARWATPEYFAACADWDQLLVDALATYPWPESAHHGIADGFDAHADRAEGLGVPEAAQPEANLPATRWGLAPVTRFQFEAQPGGSYRLEAVLRCSFSDQAISVRLNDESIAHLAITRRNDPYSVVVDLRTTPGLNTIAFHYAVAHQPPSPDPRKLGAQFQALRVRTTSEASGEA